MKKGRSMKREVILDDSSSKSDIEEDTVDDDSMDDETHLGKEKEEQNAKLKVTDVILVRYRFENGVKHFVSQIDKIASDE